MITRQWIQVVSQVICILAPFSFSKTAEFGFSSYGKKTRVISYSKLNDLVPAQALQVWEPHEGKTAKYKGYPLRALLTEIYGTKWHEAGIIVFFCQDGYKAAVPRVLFESNDSILAIERLDSGKFIARNKGQNETVSLAPFYLVWDNLNNPQLKAEGATNWPYQVVGIEITDFATKYPRMSPPSSAGVAITRGFASFQKHCLTCHTVNGDGGDKGGELNTPGVSAFKRMGREKLEKWILNPRAFRPTTKMPALHSSHDPTQVASDIASYLEEMGKIAK